MTSAYIRTQIERPIMRTFNSITIGPDHASISSRWADGSVREEYIKDIFDSIKSGEGDPVDNLADDMLRIDEQYVSAGGELPVAYIIDLVCVDETNYKIVCKRR